MATFFEKQLLQLVRAGITQEIVDRIRAHIDQVDPPGLFQISPHRMAKEWQLSPREVLEAFLYATRIGIFDLRWQIRCPYCQGISESTSHLVWLRSNAYCEYCQIEFQAGFDTSIEVTFEVNEEVRPFDLGRWIQTMDHICKINPLSWKEVMTYWDWLDSKASLTIEAQSIWKRQVKLGDGTYYLHSDDFFSLLVPLPVEGEFSQDQQRVEIVFDGTRLIRASGSPKYHPGVLIVQITNASNNPLHLYFSRRKGYPWTSAAQLVSNQTFRDLFGSEIVSADETFPIQNIVFVFTDIYSSTSLYKELGDDRAYFLIKEYFKILTQKVQEHNGAIVKKIGDTVMATFLSPIDALNAIFESQKAFNEFHQKEQLQTKMLLKAGIHRGPCVIVTLNDRLDYFGQTVNVAAMIQRLSTGNEILMTYEFYQDLLVQEVIKNNGWKARRFRAAVGSKEEVFDVVQLTP